MTKVSELVSQNVSSAITNYNTWGKLAVNVKTYGAVGDGINDDTLAIQAAIDYAISIRKKEVTFPAGTYKYTILTNVSEMSFIGDGVTLNGTTQITLQSIGLFSSEIGILANLTTLNKTSLVNSSIEETSRRKDIGINIKDFGAVLDGTTDDSAAFINAITALASTGGTIFVPSGVSCITQTLNINNPNIYLVGNGSDYNHDLGTTVGGTVIRWIGSTGGGTTMINVSAVSGASNRALANPSVQNMNLDCNSKADYALKVFSVRKGIFTDLLISNPLVVGIQTGVVSTLGEARDTQFCRFSNIDMRLIEAAAGKGIQITGDTLANTSFNLFSQIDITHKNGTAIEMGGSDNNQFLCIRTNRASGGTGIGIDLLASSVSSGQAATAIYLTQISAGTGGMTLRGNTYSSSAFVSGYGRGNAEPLPVIEVGAILNYNDEYNFNSGFLFGSTVFSEDETTARAEKANLGSNSMIIRNNSAGGVIFSDGTNKFLFRMNNPNFEIIQLAGSGTFVLPSATSIGSTSNGVAIAQPTTASWIAPTLLNGWVNYGSVFETAGYYKDSMNIVRIRGVIKGGTASINTVLFTLPAGYRPSLQIIKAVVSNDAFGQLQIKNTGDVIVINVSNISLVLDMSFRAEL